MDRSPALRKAAPGGISEVEFNATVDKFANRDLLVKDENGNWRRKDLI